MSDDYTKSVFDRVTQTILHDLEQGVRPWQKPWNTLNSSPSIVRPKRHNGEAYRGVNTLLLWDAALQKGYQNPTWMTFKQAEDYGAKIRKGEKAAWIVYANKVTKTETDSVTGDSFEKQIPFLRGYSVFNVEQIDGLPESFQLQSLPSPSQTTLKLLDNVDHFLRNIDADIRGGGDRAYYTERHDYIQMPLLEAFKDTESYYATLAHEITHWTKHTSRLHRDFGQKTSGDAAYAKEELVAELGSAFLCADLNITPVIRDDHAAYIGHWLQALKQDKKLIFSLAAHATRAVEFLKAQQPDYGLKPDQAPLCKTLYISPSVLIEQHAWRLLIEQRSSQRLARYEFQEPRSALWLKSQLWRDFNNPDCDHHLPRGLARLYEHERPALMKYGLLVPAPSNKQLSLSL